MAKKDLNEKVSKDEEKSTKVLYKIIGDIENVKFLFEKRTLDNNPFMKDLYEGKSVEVDENLKIVKMLIDNKIIVKE